MENLVKAMRDVVVANRILAREGVVDAYGHVSMRHPDNPDHYLMSRSRSPELVTLDDIMEFRLDGEPIDDRGRTPYAERHIHGAIYEKRPEMTSAVHNHSHDVIPYTITPVKLRPVAHVGAAIGAEVPVWDIRDNFGETDHLVLTMEQGRDLAKTLGDNKVALMRGHGGVVSGGDVRESVMTAVYLQVNAKLLLQCLQLGTPNYLTATEIEKCTARQFNELSLDRAWDYWCARAGGDSL